MVLVSAGSVQGNCIEISGSLHYASPSDTQLLSLTPWRNSHGLIHLKFSCTSLCRHCPDPVIRSPDLMFSRQKTAVWGGGETH